MLEVNWRLVLVWEWWINLGGSTFSLGYGAVDLESGVNE